VAKPAGQPNRNAAIHALAQDLSPKIHALTQRDLFTPRDQGLQMANQQAVIPGLGSSQPAQAQPAILRGSRPPLFPSAAPQRAQPISARPTALGIGVSTGGPAALDVLLPMLPADFPLPVMIVQHMPELFTKVFAERLDARCKLRVREGAEGDPVRPGTISIARGNWHMEVLAAPHAISPPTLHLSQGPLENHCRPAVDVLFRSVAAVYGAGVLAVVLTGMGSDGMIGCRIIREHGGTVLAQDQASSIVWGMPGAVTNAGLAHRVLPLADIAPEILRIVRRTNGEARELRESAV
jgi:two-component system chemotaxis response regulator CheB